MASRPGPSQRSKPVLPEDALSPEEYGEYRPLMFSIAYRMTGSVSDAEDIVQEAFLRLTQVLRDGTSIGSPKAYLATATTRLAISHLRSARVRRATHRGGLAAAPPPPLHRPPPPPRAPPGRPPSRGRPVPPRGRRPPPRHT